MTIFSPHPADASCPNATSPTYFLSGSPNDHPRSQFSTPRALPQTPTGNVTRRKQTRGDSTPHADPPVTPNPQQPPVFSLVARDEELRACQAREAVEDLRRKCEEEEEQEKA